MTKVSSLSRSAGEVVGRAASSKAWFTRCLMALACSMSFRNKQFSSTPGTPKVLFTEPTCSQSGIDSCMGVQAIDRGGLKHTSYAQCLPGTRLLHCFWARQRVYAMLDYQLMCDFQDYARPGTNVTLAASFPTNARHILAPTLTAKTRTS